MRGISWLAAKLVSFARRTLLHGVSKYMYNSPWKDKSLSMYFYPSSLSLNGTDRCSAFEQDQDGVTSWSCWKDVYKLVRHIPLLNVRWINSWWWTEELSETCRVSCQNKFVKLVHLVGFITNKFVTMHGHVNVKMLSAYFVQLTDLKLCVLDGVLWWRLFLYR
jgi:hypothetical protein